MDWLKNNIIDILKYLIATLGLGGIVSTYFKKYINKKIKESHENEILLKAVAKGIKEVLKTTIFKLCDEIINQGYFTDEQFDELTEKSQAYYDLGGNGICHKKVKYVFDNYKIKPDEDLIKK